MVLLYCTCDSDQQQRSEASIDRSVGVILGKHLIGRIEKDRELGPVFRVDQLIKPQRRRPLIALIASIEQFPTTNILRGIKVVSDLEGMCFS